jgi:hypothetical protein
MWPRMKASTSVMCSAFIAGLAIAALSLPHAQSHMGAQPQGPLTLRSADIVQHCALPVSHQSWLHRMVVVWGSMSWWSAVALV